MGIGGIPRSHSDLFNLGSVRSFIQLIESLVQLDVIIESLDFALTKCNFYSPKAVYFVFGVRSQSEVGSSIKEFEHIAGNRYSRESIWCSYIINHLEHSFGTPKLFAYSNFI